MEKTFDTTFDFGIGLHFGPAVVGHTGHPLKMQLTVMGDTVNIASRVEGKTKLTNSRILATGAFASHVRPFVTTGRKHRFKLTRAGRWDTLEEIPVRGIKDPALLVQTGYDLVRTGAPTFAETFYQRLFALAPHLAVLFTTTDMEIQRRMLMEMIGRAVQRIHRPEEIAPMLRELGARHATYGVKPEYYELAGKALVETLELRACLKSGKRSRGKQKGWMADSRRRRIPLWAVTEERRRQTAFFLAARRVERIFGPACVRRSVTAHCGDAPSRRPWPGQNSAQRDPFPLFRHALSLGDRFFPAMRRAWQTVYGQIAAHMMTGAAGGSVRPIAGLG